MKETSRINSSLLVHGSRPSTFNSPSYDVSPRIALRAVVFPAPFGPIRPRMRPSSTRKSTPSSATVVPYDLRRPRASMHAMASAFLLFLLSRFLFPCSIQQFFRLQSQPLDRRVNLRPLFLQKILSFVLQQKLSRSRSYEHPQSTFALHQFFIHQFLISLQDREWIHAVIRRHRSYRWQRITFPQHPIQNHRHHAIAELAINRLAIVPFTSHSRSQFLSTNPRCGLFPTIATLHRVLSEDVAPGNQGKQDHHHGNRFDVFRHRRSNLVRGPHWIGKRDQIDCLPDHFEHQNRQHLNGVANSQCGNGSQSSQHRHFCSVCDRVVVAMTNYGGPDEHTQTARHNEVSDSQRVQPEQGKFACNWSRRYAGLRNSDCAHGDSFLSLDFAANELLRPRQFHVRVHRLVPRLHIGPVFR